MDPRTVRASAEEAGRDPAAITVLVCAPAYVDADLPHARDQCRWFGGMVGNHVVEIVRRYGDGKAPAALTAYVAARKGYDYAHHGRASNPDTDFVSDEVVDRFCVLGSSAQHIAKLRDLEDAGMDQFAMYLMHDNEERTLEAYGEEVIPAFR